MWNTPASKGAAMAPKKSSLHVDASLKKLTLCGQFLQNTSSSLVFRVGKFFNHDVALGLSLINFIKHSENSNLPKQRERLERIFSN